MTEKQAQMIKDALRVVKAMRGDLEDAGIHVAGFEGLECSLRLASHPNTLLGSGVDIREPS